MRILDIIFHRFNVYDTGLVLKQEALEAFSLQGCFAALGGEHPRRAKTSNTPRPKPEISQEVFQ